VDVTDVGVALAADQRVADAGGAEGGLEGQGDAHAQVAGGAEQRDGAELDEVDGGGARRRQGLAAAARHPGAGGQERELEGAEAQRGRRQDVAAGRGEAESQDAGVQAGGLERLEGLAGGLGPGGDEVADQAEVVSSGSGNSGKSGLRPPTAPWKKMAWAPVDSRRRVTSPGQSPVAVVGASSDPMTGWAPKRPEVDGLAAVAGEADELELGVDGAEGLAAVQRRGGDGGGGGVEAGRGEVVEGVGGRVGDGLGEAVEGGGVVGAHEALGQRRGPVGAEAGVGVGGGDEEGGLGQRGAGGGGGVELGRDDEDVDGDEDGAGVRRGTARGRGRGGGRGCAGCGGALW
jgi:hypothetical protein